MCDNRCVLLNISRSCTYVSLRMYSKDVGSDGIPCPFPSPILTSPRTPSRSVRSSSFCFDACAVLYFELTRCSQALAKVPNLQTLFILKRHFYLLWWYCTIKIYCDCFCMLLAHCQMKQILLLVFRHNVVSSRLRSYCHVSLSMFFLLVSCC